MKRFQECNWLEKLWRYRWYFLVPIKWAWYSLFSKFKVYIYDIETSEHTDLGYDVIRGKQLWDILKSSVQYNMGWYYTSEEVFESLKDKIDEKRRRG